VTSRQLEKIKKVVLPNYFKLTVPHILKYCLLLLVYSQNTFSQQDSIRTRLFSDTCYIQKFQNLCPLKGTPKFFEEYRVESNNDSVKTIDKFCNKEKTILISKRFNRYKQLQYTRIDSFNITGLLIETKEYDKKNNLCKFDKYSIDCSNKKILKYSLLPDSFPICEFILTDFDSISSLTLFGSDGLCDRKEIRIYNDSHKSTEIIGLQKKCSDTCYLIQNQYRSDQLIEVRDYSFKNNVRQFPLIFEFSYNAKGLLENRKVHLENDSTYMISDYKYNPSGRLLTFKNTCNYTKDNSKTVFKYRGNTIITKIITHYEGKKRIDVFYQDSVGCREFIKNKGIIDGKLYANSSTTVERDSVGNWIKDISEGYSIFNKFYKNIKIRKITYW
jgi:hypothetical protein